MAASIFKPLSKLSEQIKKGRVSPIELTENSLTRLEKLGPRYNSVVTVTRRLAMKQARKAEKEIEAGKYRGPLHGVPWGAKDLLSTKGIPTT